MPFEYFVVNIVNEIIKNPIIWKKAEKEKENFNA